MLIRLVRYSLECLLFGIFMALLLLLLGVGGLIVYEILTAQSLHLALFSLPLAELKGGQSFQIALQLNNIFPLGIVLALLCACLAWLLGIRQRLTRGSACSDG